MKVQTGLRIPEQKYEALAAYADRIGVSINALVLMLIDIGWEAINLGIRESDRAGLHDRQDNA